VEIRFRRKQDQRCYEQFAVARRRWGEKIARLYIRRVNILAACQSMADLSTFPQLRFHSLKGARQGQYALDIDERMRLILSVGDDAKTIVVVEEVSKHYGD
jgi:proteic killer suppression protein